MFVLIFTLFFYIYGLCIGSFLNVLIYRIPLEIQVSKGRSFCPSCNHSLGAIDLVPVFSYLFLKGKCRYCGKPISARYPLVELLTGVLFAICGYFNLLNLPYAIILCLFVSALVVASFIDLDHGFIPDRIHIFIIGLAAVYFLIEPNIRVLNRSIEAVLIGGGIFILSYLTKEGIGMGDVKLMAAATLLIGAKLAVIGFFMAYIFAAAVIIVPYMKKQLPKGYEVPMAPYFSLALMIMVLFGEKLLSWYLTIFF